MSKLEDLRRTGKKVIDEKVASEAAERAENERKRAVMDVARAAAWEVERQEVERKLKEKEMRLKSYWQGTEALKLLVELTREIPNSRLVFGEDESGMMEVLLIARVNNGESNDEVFFTRIRYIRPNVEIIYNSGEKYIAGMSDKDGVILLSGLGGRGYVGSWENLHDNWERLYRNDNKGKYKFLLNPKKIDVIKDFGDHLWSGSSSRFEVKKMELIKRGFYTSKGLAGVDGSLEELVGQDLFDAYAYLGDRARWLLDKIIEIEKDEDEALNHLNNWFLGYGGFALPEDYNRAKQVLVELETKIRKVREEEKKEAEKMMKEHDRLGEKARQLLDGILREKDDLKKYQALDDWLVGFGKVLFPFPDDYEKAKAAFEEVERTIKEAENQRKPDLDKARSLLEEFREYCGSSGTRLDQFLKGKRFRGDGWSDKNDIPPIVDNELNVSSDLSIDGLEFKILFEVGNPTLGFQTMLKKAFVLQMREGTDLLPLDKLNELKSLRKGIHIQFLLFLKAEGIGMPPDCKRFILKLEETRK